MGGPVQPDYVNAAIRVKAQCRPRQLLVHLLEVELQLGRIRRERWGPRTIDLDFLWARGVVEESTHLQIPHPRLRVRPFALVPLIDVAPDAVDPTDGFSYRQVLQRLEAPTVTMLASQW